MEDLCVQIDRKKALRFTFGMPSDREHPVCLKEGCKVIVSKIYVTNASIDFVN